MHYRIPLEPQANWAPTAHLTNYLHKLLDYSTLGAAGDAVLQQAFVDLDVRKDGVWNGISYNGAKIAQRQLSQPARRKKKFLQEKQMFPGSGAKSAVAANPSP